MWHRDLIARLAQELPRWRWKSGLTHRGGTLDGETQKQAIQIKIEYARGRWILNVQGLLGHRQPQWVLTIEDAEFTALDDLLATILAECK